MTVEEMILDNGYEDVVIFKNPSYDTAFIGVSDDNRAIYNFELMVDYLMKEDGMSETDAIEFIEYNTLRAGSYVVNSPIVMYPLIDFDE